MVTKGPEQLKSEERLECSQKFNPKPNQLIAFSYITYRNLKHLFSEETQACNAINNNTEVFLITGIANPLPLLNHLKGYSANIQHHDYPDHHSFSKRNIENLLNAFKNTTGKEKIIITTEKDAQRLLGITFKELLLNLPIFYLSIEIDLQKEDRTTFDQKILNYVSSTTRNR
ncbi:tetraacyldisaccharide 4'-kinase [compost metagenome]